MQQGILYTLLQKDTSAAITGPAILSNPLASVKAIHAILKGTGAITATVIIEASNTPDAEAWLEMGVITMSGTTVKAEGLIVDVQWLYTRARLTTITGTAAKIYVDMAV